MDHYSIVFVVERDGIIQTFIDHGETPEAIIKALREALVS